MILHRLEENRRFSTLIPPQIHKRYFLRYQSTIQFIIFDLAEIRRAGSKMLMEGTRNYLILLLLRELHEVYRITGNAYGQLRIQLGMLLGIEKRLTVKHVDVQMLAVLLHVAIEKHKST